MVGSMMRYQDTRKPEPILPPSPLPAPDPAFEEYFNRRRALAGRAVAPRDYLRKRMTAVDPISGQMLSPDLSAPPGEQPFGLSGQDYGPLARAMPQDVPSEFEKAFQPMGSGGSYDPYLESEEFRDAREAAIELLKMEAMPEAGFIKQRDESRRQSELPAKRAAAEKTARDYAARPIITKEQGAAEGELRSQALSDFQKYHNQPNEDLEGAFAQGDEALTEMGIADAEAQAKQAAMAQRGGGRQEALKAQSDPLEEMLMARLSRQRGQSYREPGIAEVLAMIAGAFAPGATAQSQFKTAQAFTGQDDDGDRSGDDANLIRLMQYRRQKQQDEAKASAGPKSSEILSRMKHAESPFTGFESDLFGILKNPFMPPSDREQLLAAIQELQQGREAFAGSVRDTGNIPLLADEQTYPALRRARDLILKKKAAEPQ